MSNQHPTSKFTFTLEESAAEPDKQPQAQQEEFDWERGLEKLREKRQMPLQTDPAHTDIHIAPAEAPARPQPEPAAPAAASRNVDAATREKVLREYLQQWQQAHNEAVAEETPIEETDATVLLQEDWLSAQAALRTAADEHIEATHTVWLNPQRRALQTQADEAGQGSDAAHESRQDSEEADLAVAPDQLPVTVQVINPQVNPSLPVMCLSEQELMERLVKRLRPHLTDAVSGMVRVAVQKQTAALTYQLQQSLNEQTPDLVDEILAYNLKAVMSEIRYDLKFKRNKG